MKRCLKKLFAGLFSLSLVAISLPTATATPSVSAQEIMQKAVARAQRPDSNAGQAGYTYTKVTLTEELNAEGKVKERKQRLYQVFFQGGTTRLKLLEVNGVAPSAAELKKLSENESNVRQILGHSKEGKGDSRENFLTPELTERFAFELAGESAVGGRRTYEIHFQPKRSDLPVHHLSDKLVNRISGTIWIDSEEYEIARAEVRLGSEVNLLGGVIGSLKKLAFSLTRTRVGEGVWFNTFSSGDFEGRKLIDFLRIKTRSESSNFR